MSTSPTPDRLSLTCPHCWATREIDLKAWRASTSHYCSPECKGRDAAWDAWVRKTNRLALTGDIAKPIDLGPQLPPGGKGLAASVARFAVTDPAQEALFDAA